MNITLCSAFRNSSPETLGRYCHQAHDLYRELRQRGAALNLVLGEGDSTNHTRVDLEILFRGAPCTIVDVSHGGQVFGSVVDAQRFKQLAHVAGRIWAEIPDTADAILWIESDLIWSASTMLALLDRLKEYPAISPMVLLHREGYSESTWYDTWAFRRDGRNFSQNYPYHAAYVPDRPFRVDSAGSVMAIDAKLARRLVWDDRLFPGICEQIGAFAGSVWVDPGCVVYHT